MKKFKWLFFWLALLGITSLLIYGYISKNVQTSSIHIQELSEKDGVITIKGDLNHSKYKFAGYNYSVVKGKVYMTISGVIFTGKKKTFDFTIKDKNVANTPNIIFRSSPSDEKVVQVEREK